MHRGIFFVVAAAGVLAAPVAQADEALLKKHNCVACHQIDKKVVGPAYKDVAKKYKGQKDVAVKLEEGQPGRVGPGADAAQSAGSRRR